MNSADHNQPADAERQAHSPEDQLPSDILDVECQLNQLGLELRQREGLSARIHAASADHLPAPEPVRFSDSNPVRVWGRLALAACILLAFAVASRMLLSPQSPTKSTDQPSGLIAAETTGSSHDVLDYDFGSETETDAVLVALIDGGLSGHIEAIEGLEGSDEVGAAFAPILGTTGVSFDDYLAEMSVIEVELRR